MEEERIRAYQLYIDRVCTGWFGDERLDWFMAEWQVKNGRDKYGKTIQTFSVWVVANDSTLFEKLIHLVNLLSLDCSRIESDDKGRRIRVENASAAIIDRLRQDGFLIEDNQ